MRRGGVLYYIYMVLSSCIVSYAGASPYYNNKVCYHDILCKCFEVLDCRMEDLPQVP